MEPTVIIALLAVVFGPLLAYITASRKLSGKVETSEAEQLWAESKAIRDDYRDRLAGTDVRTAALEARVAVLEALNIELNRENMNLKGRLLALEAENFRLRDRLPPDPLNQETP